MRFPLWPFFLATLLSSCNSFEPKVEIAPWKGDKKAAVALTFDDWTPGHPAIVVPELQKRGMVATFNIITTTVKDWEPLRHAASLGNEMANHTATHPHPHGISFIEEISGAKEKIEAEIPTQKVLTFAYPYGEATDSMKAYLNEKGYVAARGTSTPMTDPDFTADGQDYLDTKSYSVMSETTLSDYAEQLAHVKRVGGMLTFLYHSVFNDSIRDFSYAWVVDSIFQQQLDTLNSFDLWVGTFADIVGYHQQYTHTKIEKIESSKNSFVFRLKESQDSLQNRSCPLTVTVNVDDAENIIVEQNGVTLPVTVVNPQQILFDAHPNKGNITLTKIPFKF